MSSAVSSSSTCSLHPSGEEPRVQWEHPGDTPWWGSVPCRSSPTPAQASTSPGHLKVQPTWASIKLPDSVEYSVNQILSCYCCLWFTGNEAAALDFPPRRQEIKLINSAKRWKIPYGKGLGLGVLCVWVHTCMCRYVCTRVCAADSLINMEPLERSEQRCRELRGAWRSQDLKSERRWRQKVGQVPLFLGKRWDCLRRGCPQMKGLLRGPWGRPVEPAALTPLPAQERTSRGAGGCVMWCGALMLTVLLARVSLGMCGGPSCWWCSWGQDTTGTAPLSTFINEKVAGKTPLEVSGPQVSWPSTHLSALCEGQTQWASCSIRGYKDQDF